MFVNYDGSVLSYVASVRRYFGLSSSFLDDAAFSAYLSEQRPEKIFVFLIDALGANLISRKLDETAFLKKNMRYALSTVFPSTTTAATTAIRNGKAPNENAWLGWAQYLKEADDIIVPFLSKGFYNDISYEKDIFARAVPVNDTVKELKRKGIRATSIFPSFMEGGCDSISEMCERLLRCSWQEDYRYIYAYWDRYDTYMHKYGVDASFCDSYLQYMNEEIAKMAAKLKDDTLLLVLADHGQIETKRYYNLYHSEYDRYFLRRPSLESRAMVFFIHKGLEKEFEEKFKKEFADDCILLSHEQVLSSKLFGPHRNHPRFEEFIGDYLAIAKSDLAFIYHERDKKVFIGQHAGICEDEMLVPLIVYMNR